MFGSLSENKIFSLKVCFKFINFNHLHKYFGSKKLSFLLKHICTILKTNFLSKWTHLFQQLFITVKIVTLRMPFSISNTQICSYKKNLFKLLKIISLLFVSSKSLKNFNQVISKKRPFSRIVYILRNIAIKSIFQGYSKKPNFTQSVDIFGDMVRKLFFKMI